MFKQLKIYIVLPILLILGLLLFADATWAQKQQAFKFENRPYHDQTPYHFGFSLGFNQMNFSLNSREDLKNIRGKQEGLVGFTEFDTLYTAWSVPEYGFNIGIVSNLKLSPMLDLRFIPTLTFGDRNIRYEGYKNNQDVVLTERIESTFLDFPLHIKYKSVRMTNTRVYVIGGIKYSYDLAALGNKDDLDDLVLVRLKENDFFYELGVGFDFYFYYFRFSTELKASFGMRNMLKRENNMFNSAINELSSQILMISFLFEE